MTAKQSWTGEQVDELRRLVAEGLTARKIGEKLGFSRNSVIGKMRRTDIPGRPHRAKPPRPRSERRPHRAKPKPWAPAVVGVAPEPVDVVVPVLLARPKRAKARRTVLTVRSGECRWPHGDPREKGFYFCGAAVVRDKAYCNDHCREAYQGWAW